MADRGRRGVERDVAANPGDGDGWLRLAHDRLRRGEREGSAEIVREGVRLHPAHPGLLARAAELSEGSDPWPTETGAFDRARCSAVLGPQEGVQRWRVELPHPPIGCPLVHADGSVFVRLFPAGMLRVAPDASQTWVHSHWWPSHVEPVLLDGLPVAFDPGLDSVSGAGVDADAPQELWPVAVGPDGWILTPSTGTVIGVGPEPGERWRGGSCTGMTSGLAVSKAGLVAAPDHEDVRVLEARSGEERWLTRAGQRPGFAPDGSLVVIGSSLACYEPNGALRWSRRLGVVSFALDAGLVVAVGASEGVVGLDLRTGEPRWRLRGLRDGVEVAMDVRGYAYVFGPGWFAAIDAQGRLVFRLPLPVVGARGGVALGQDRTAFVTVGEQLIAIR